jgi:4-carboxymuconolactone decarboxylase
MSIERFPAMTPEEMTDEQKAAADTFAEGRGYDVRGPFLALLRSPEVMLRAKAMGDYLRFKSSLPPRLSEMAILITARFWSQNYEWHAHRPLAEKGGLDPAIADAIADGRRPETMAEDEEVLYDFATELHVNKSVSDTTFARAKALFGDQGVIDLTAINGYYTLIAMVLNVGRTQLPAGAVPGMERFPK